MTEDLPIYRITVELMRPMRAEYDGDYFAFRTWDTNRVTQPMTFNRLLTHFSIEVASRAVSFWIARSGAGFVDGPWYPRPRVAEPGDFGLCEKGLSEYD